MNKIILDTDPGIDDAMAIFTAMAHPEIELLGLTTTFGNVSVDQATTNALSLVEMAGVNIPVARGVATPWVKDLSPFPDFVHGVNGFGNVSLAPPKGTAIAISAAQFIVEQVNANPGEVTLVAIGPLGNLATALQIDPSIAQKVKEVVLMGGVIAADGNVSPVAEANILSDPDAADKVMAAAWSVVIVGLDVTHQVILNNALFDRIARENPKVGKFMAQAAEFYIKFYSSIRDIDGCYAHDVSAVAYVVDPSIFGVIEGEVCVATEGVAIGQTIMSRFGIPYPLTFWENRPKQKACMAVDSAKLVDLFATSMTSDFWR